MMFTRSTTYVMPVLITVRNILGAATLFGMLAMSAGSQTAQAQTDNSNATPAQRRACTPDVYRLCAGEIPSVSKITSCLRRNKASLSEACRAVFEQ